MLISEGVFRSDTLHEGMVLDISTKHEVSAESLKKLRKTQVIFLSEAEEMVHRIKGISNRAEYFSRKEVFLVKV